MESIIERQKQLEKLPDYDTVRRSKKRFYDKQFPPTFESIFSSKQSKFEWNEKKQHYKQNREQYERCVGWIRLTELFPIYELRVVDNLSPRDIRQGHIGNCYFMSFLGAIVNQWPEQIEKMFTTKNVNFTGYYEIQLKINGHYTTMVVDDYVPYDKETNQLIYAK